MENFVDDAQSAFGSFPDTHQQTPLFAAHQRKLNQITIRDLYQAVPKSDILNLTKSYAIDFYVHGYSIEDVLRL